MHNNTTFFFLQLLYNSYYYVGHLSMEIIEVYTATIMFLCAYFFWKRIVPLDQFF